MKGGKKDKSDEGDRNKMHGDDFQKEERDVKATHRRG